jgi:hypothetical protein
MQVGSESKEDIRWSMAMDEENAEEEGEPCHGQENTMALSRTEEEGEEEEKKKKTTVVGSLNIKRS